MSRDRLSRALLVCGLVGPLLFIATFLVDGATRPGYDPWRHLVSQLGTGERGWLQITNFIFCGLLVLAGAVGLWRAGVSRFVTVLVGAIGIGLVGAGVFVTDPGLGYPPGARPPSPPTLHDTIHVLVSIVVFVGLSVVAVIAGLLDRRRSIRWAAYSVLSGAAVLGFIVAAGRLAAEQEQVVTADAPIGVLQRISILAGFVWLSGFFLRAMRSVVSR